MLVLNQIPKYLEKGYQLRINRNGNTYQGCVLYQKRATFIENVEEIDAQRFMEGFTEVASELLPGRILSAFYDIEQELFQTQIERQVIEGVCYKGLLKREVVEDYSSRSAKMQESMEALNTKIFLKKRGN